MCYGGYRLWWSTRQPLADPEALGEPCVVDRAKRGFRVFGFGCRA